MIVLAGLLFTGLVLISTARRGSARRWGTYVAAAAGASVLGGIGGMAWYNAVLCTSYSLECDVGPYYGALWAMHAAVGSLVVGAVIEIVKAARSARTQAQ